MMKAVTFTLHYTKIVPYIFRYGNKSLDCRNADMSVWEPPGNSEFQNCITRLVLDREAEQAGYRKMFESTVRELLWSYNSATNNPIRLCRS